MAKKSATKKSTAAKTAKPAAEKVTAKTAKKSTAKATAPKTPLSEESIGIAAGELWARLTEKPATVAELKKATSCSDELTLVAIGWLAREGKLHFETTSRSVTLSLA